jgi:hypothetical protein
VSGNTAAVGFSVALLALIIIWLWLNVMLIRRMRTKKAQATPVTDLAADTREVSTSEPRGRVSGTVTDIAPGPDEADAVVGQALQDARSPRAEMVPGNAPDTVSDADDTFHSPEVSIQETPEGRSVFNSKQVPFYVRNTPDSPFLSGAWMTALQKLSQDSNILGWIAFHGNTVGASDHRYDDALTEVLKSYRSMLERLRQEVGLTQVLETSIVGVEGKIWILSARDDVWLSLFLDHTVNAQEVVKELLPPELSATTR